MAANILVAGLSPDKHTKGVTLLKPTLRERIALRKIQMADSEGGLMLTGTLGAFSVFLTTVLGMETGFFGTEFLGVAETIGITAGGGVLSAGGYKALSGFSNKNQFIVEQYNKKALEESEIRQ